MFSAISKKIIHIYFVLKESEDQKIMVDPNNWLFRIQDWFIVIYTNCCCTNCSNFDIGDIGIVGDMGNMCDICDMGDIIYVGDMGNMGDINDMDNMVDMDSLWFTGLIWVHMGLSELICVDMGWYGLIWADIG